MKDSIYVVSEVDPPRWEGDCWGVRVVGNRTFCLTGKEVFWHQDRFRKLSDLQNESRLRKTKQEPACT